MENCDVGKYLILYNLIIIIKDYILFFQLPRHKQKNNSTTMERIPSRYYFPLCSLSTILITFHSIFLKNYYIFYSSPFLNKNKLSINAHNRPLILSFICYTI